MTQTSNGGRSLFGSSREGRAWLPLMLALALACGCSGSRDDGLKTNNIRTAEAADPEDDAEVDGMVEEGPSDDDAGHESEDAGATLDGTVVIADAGEAPDTTVVMETPRCGNGAIDPGEQCDLGASNSDSMPGACRRNCRLARCGDGVLDQGEQCDQAASNSDSEPNTCRANCTRARCGDNVVDQGEQCDSGETRSNTAPGACRVDCRSARCSDGVRDGDEACDDGNTVDTDACRNNCRSARCGDGVVDADEECDDGNTRNGDDCQNTCRPPVCGDRVVDPGEQCDDGNIVENDGCRRNCMTGCVAASACSDGAFCNGAERCVNGECRPSAITPNLDDGVDCTADACDEATDRVTHTATDSLCIAQGPSCSAASSTTHTATCDATRGCVDRTTTRGCGDTPSSCTPLRDGSFTLTAYTPVCNSENSSCAAATPSSRTCASIPASCNNRVFTGIAAATCDPDAESCGTRTPTMDDCKTRDRSSCATDNSSFTQVRGTCSGAGCATSEAVISPCLDPADRCVNAQRSTSTPTCSATTGCGTPNTVTETCAVRGPSCANNGPKREAAITRYAPTCAANGQTCDFNGMPQTPAVCTTPSGVTCAFDAQQRAVQTVTRPSCDAAGTACSSTGSQTLVYCDAAPIYCLNNVATLPVNRCNGTACGTTTQTCTQGTSQMCTATGFETRTYSGACANVTGCVSTVQTTTCPAPTCTNNQYCTSKCATNPTGATGLYCQTTCAACRLCLNGTSCGAIVAPGLTVGTATVGSALGNL